MIEDIMLLVLVMVAVIIYLTILVLITKPLVGKKKALREKVLQKYNKKVLVFLFACSIIFYFIVRWLISRYPNFMSSYPGIGILEYIFIFYVVVSTIIIILVVHFLEDKKEK